MNPNFPKDLLISPSHHPQNHLFLSSTSATPNSRPFDSDPAFSAQAQADAILKYGIAGRIWEAAYTMMLYLDDSRTHEFDPPPFTSTHVAPITALELGSGTGIVGLALAERLAIAGRQQDRIILTDLPEVCRLLEENLHQQPADAVAISTVRPLAWGNAEHAEQIAEGMRMGLCRDRNPTQPLTHIVCSDLVYFPELLAPLLRTLLQLTSRQFIPAHLNGVPEDNHPWHPAEVVVSYKIRSLAKETPFWSAFGLWFLFVPVLVRPRSEPSATAPAPWRRFGEDDDAFIFIAQRRPDSLDWKVPPDDAALLGGVGARDSESSISDDTFELLLLMNLDDD